MRIFMLFISRFEQCVESSVYTMCHPSCHRAASSKPKVKQALVAQSVVRSVCVKKLKCKTQNLPGKLGQQSAICLNSLGLFRDHGLNFLGIICFCFSRQKTETFSICLKQNFVKPHKTSTHSAYSNNSYFHFLYPLSD